MNVCVVTWYKSPNYGTCLQAIALTYALRDLGHDVYMLSYGRRYTVRDGGRIVRKLKKKLKIRMKKAYTYANQQKNVSIQKCVDDTFQFLSVKDKKSERSTLDLIDCFIVGSDQVWNPNHFDEVYMLDFVPDSITKISYASSLGVTSLPAKLTKKYKRLLDRFDHLSVREASGAKVISELIQKSVDVVIDPTLLISAQRWREFAANAKIENDIPKKYIFAYFVGKQDRYWESLRKISESLGMDVVVVPLAEIENDDTFYFYETAGPYEFIELINRAELICTDSFHACAFALNLNKRFVAFRRFNSSDLNSQNSRLDSLFSLTNIGNMYYEDGGMSLLNKNIDYRSVNKILDGERIRCESYLRQSIKKRGEKVVSNL